MDALSATSDAKIHQIHLLSNFREGQAPPSDPGVALWFELDGTEHCIAVDTYDDASSNVTAVQYILMSLVMAQSRGTSLHDACSEYAIRMDPTNLGKSTDDVNEIMLGDTLPEIRVKFAMLAKKAHPDVGGSREEWDRVVLAYEQAKARAAYHTISSEKFIFDDDGLIDFVDLPKSDKSDPKANDNGEKE